MTTPDESPDEPQPHVPPLPVAPPVSEPEHGPYPSPDQVTSSRPPYASLAVGLLLYAIVAGYMIANGMDKQGYNSLGYFVAIVFLSMMLFIAGIATVVSPRSRHTGAGLLISVAIGIIVDGGVCVGLISRH